ncbi:acyl carrier protein [Curvivirga sp.]|uniref:acyl carrier protein n=1 Tax=Curvivirga sp. TaxID=2856848 RepID=UPI003B5C2C88
MTREDIILKLQSYLEELFEVDPADATLDASLYEDLDMDSIDAVDLVIKLQELTGKKIAPEDFKSVRTVGDVVDQVEALVSQ